LQVIPKGSGIVPRSFRDCKHWDGQNAATFGSKNGGPAVLSTQMKTLARELVALEPNVIVVISTPVTAAVMQETHTIPIIYGPTVAPPRQAKVQSRASYQFLGRSRTTRAFIAALHFYAGTRNKMCHFPP
jgi:hypothetical protein